jgi:hypothetical protein
MRSGLGPKPQLGTARHRTGDRAGIGPSLLPAPTSWPPVGGDSRQQDANFLAADLRPGSITIREVAIGKDGGRTSTQG